MRISTHLAAWAVGVLTSASLCRAQTTPHLSWTYSSGSPSWLARDVGLGEGGNQVFFATEGSGARARLLSATDSQPPSPFWQSVAFEASQPPQVTSAWGADLSAMAWIATVASADRLLIARYRSTRLEPVWTYQSDFAVPGGSSFGVEAAEAGGVLVGWACEGWNTRVVVLDPEGGQILRQGSFNTLGSPWNVRLSRDGSTLALLSASKLVVVDVQSLTSRYQYLPPSTTGALAISGQGRTIAMAWSGGCVRLFREQGTSYVGGALLPGIPGARCCALSLDRAGETLIAGYTDATHYGGVTVQILDVRADAGGILLQESVPGEGSYQNVVSAVDMAADGRTAVAGLSGDEMGLAPEFLVYSCSGGTWDRSFEQDLPGSVYALELGPDGSRAAVASKSMHINVAGGSGRIDLFDLARRDLALVGAPRAGTTAELRHYTRPSTPSLLLVSTHEAAHPTPFGATGTLWLERTTMSVAHASVGGSEGYASHAIVLTGAVGEQRVFQALALSPRRLSEDRVRVTLLP